MSSTWLRAVTMNLSLPPGRPQRLLINPLAQLPPWHSVVNCVWAFSCFYFSFGCSARWEGAGLDSTLTVRGLGEEVPGEVGFEASHRVAAESVQVRECEVEAVVV